MNFTLKVKKDKITGCFMSDSRHALGGADLTQIYAFQHLFPNGFCPWGYDELLFDLARIHGWEVESAEL